MTSTIRQLRRDAVLEGVVDHVLEHGIGNASLRSLAAAVGTSDRMLLYYFSNKDELMLEVFSRVVERQATLLDKILPSGPQSFEVLLARMWEILKAPDYAPYMRIWYDALGRASQGEDLYRTLTSRVVDLWFEWFEPHSAAPLKSRREEIAAVIASACGLVMLRYLGREQDATNAARRLTRTPAKASRVELRAISVPDKRAAVRSRKK